MRIHTISNSFFITNTISNNVWYLEMDVKPIHDASKLETGAKIIPSSTQYTRRNVAINKLQFSL